MWVPERNPAPTLMSGEDVHVEAYEAVREMVSASGYTKIAMGPLSHPRAGLDIGGADVNGSARGLIPCVDRWVGLDVAPGPGVDLVADATDWVTLYHTMTANAFDVVLCTEVLEHVAQYQRIIENAWRLLAPSGFAFFTAAATNGQTWARRPHGARGELDPPHGEHYANVNVVDLATYLNWLVGGNDEKLGDYGLTVNPNPGDVYFWLRKD